MKTLTVLAFVASAVAAHAGGTSYDISGTTIGKADSSYVPLGETHMFVDIDSTYTLPQNGTPTAGMTGKCMGSMQIAFGAGASGSGTCIWSDANGDSWFGPWTVVGMTPEGMATGIWHASGGTGKFAGAAGGGTFTSATNPETGASKLDVLGSVVLK